jgi:hypothetical protein
VTPLSKNIKEPRRLTELLNEELCDFYFSPSIIRIIKSKKIRWARYMARIGGEEERVYVIDRNARRKKYHYDDQDVDGG